ncbi:MAG: hypothetical protein Q8O84_05470, partial [Nanoarchaeota archaeon]|nr:hypothetical protein [Nanoarchaeota archaeon]
MTNSNRTAEELIRMRNAITGNNVPGPSGVRRLDDDDGNLIYSQGAIVPPSIQNRLAEQDKNVSNFSEQQLQFNEQTQNNLQKYNAYSVVEVKKIESSLLKIKI